MAQSREAGGTSERIGRDLDKLGNIHLFIGGVLLAGTVVTGFVALESLAALEGVNGILHKEGGRWLRSSHPGKSKAN